MMEVDGGSPSASSLSFEVLEREVERENTNSPSSSSSQRQRQSKEKQQKKNKKGESNNNYDAKAAAFRSSVELDLVVCDPRSLALSGGGACSVLFGKFLSCGAVKQVSPTRLLTPVRQSGGLELPVREKGGEEAWHLFALFDCALEAGYPCVVVDYLLQVCLDPHLVSSNPQESFLMNRQVVETWCQDVAQYLRRAFFSMLETISPRDDHFYAKGLWIEKVLVNLKLVLDVLHPNTTPPRVVETTARARVSHDTVKGMNRLQHAKGPFPLHGGGGGMSEGLIPILGEKKRIPPSHAHFGRKTETERETERERGAFGGFHTQNNNHNNSVDSLSQGGANAKGKKKDPLDVVCLEVIQVLQACKICNWSYHEGLSEKEKMKGKYASLGEWKESLEKRSAVLGKLFIQHLIEDNDNDASRLQMDSSFGVYPFASFVDAVKKVFLSSKQQQKEAGENQSGNATSGTPGEMESEGKTKGKAMAEIKVFLYYLIDMGCSDSLVKSFATHFGLTNAECAKIKVYVQLDSLDGDSIREACLVLPSITHVIEYARVIGVLMKMNKPQVALDISRSRFNSHTFPSKEEALLILDIHLSCKGLYEGFLYCQEVWKRALDKADHIQIAQQCTQQLCKWCEDNRKTSKLMEMPFTSSEERHLETLFKNQPFWPLYLVLRRRYKEAQAALQTSSSLLDQSSLPLQRQQQLRDVFGHLQNLVDTAMNKIRVI